MKHILLTILISFSISVVNAIEHTNKKVGILHSGDTRDCFLFKLEGVFEADSVNPGNHWFAVPFNKISSKNMMSILLTAKASGALINVTTTGNTACDLAEVKNIQWP